MIRTTPRVFTALEVVSITGIPYSRLDIWTRSGVIRSSISAAAGSGSRRLYARDDVIAVRVAWNLRKDGISGKSLLKAISLLRKHNLDDVKAAKRGKGVRAEFVDTAAVSTTGPGQFYLDLGRGLTEAISHVDRALRRPAKRKD